MDEIKDRCLIFGAGEFYGLVSPIDPQRDLLIAADGGIRHLSGLGIRADIWLGDMDSAGDFFPEEILQDEEKLEKVCSELIRLPERKDDTDIFAAVKLALERGCSEFHIYGGMGGRFDHTMGNIKVLEYLAERGYRGYLYDRSSLVTVIWNSAIAFPREASGYISVFSMSDVSRGVTERGLEYELTDASLRGSDSIGVSNRFKGEESYVAVRDGKLLIILA